jgi:hypothetical protein
MARPKGTTGKSYWTPKKIEDVMADIELITSPRRQMRRKWDTWKPRKELSKKEWERQELTNKELVRQLKQKFPEKYGSVMLTPERLRQILSGDFRRKMLVADRDRFEEELLARRLGERDD